MLRSLLDKLLTAEAKVRGISAASIFVGGNQTAGDGGVDGLIAWKGAPKPCNWLPRRTNYFQCKAETMGPAKLIGEMRPNGHARPIFAELARARGAYIVFSTDDPSRSAYANRIAEMRRSILDVPNSKRIAVDFYGADKVARWVNQHPGVAIWLLEHLGHPLGGWRPFGAWSAPDSEQKSYVLDDTARASVDGRSDEMKSAVAVMRETLAAPGGVVRLVGISGMGKTRLAEVLFDDRLDVGSALPKEWAIYGDAGLELTVGAALITEQIVSAGIEAVIVVDNCTLKTHGQLAEIVKRGTSRASLLTIDYDIGGEKPAGKLVVLGDNSEKVVNGVIEQRFPMLSSAERHHLAEFSGGNARIALKLAEAGGQGIDLSKLNDSALLDRLFQTDRAQRDAAMRTCAETASLVYAFYLSEDDNHAPEHDVLADIAGVTADTFYRNVETLLEWGITQQRGPQRAVMPPPLANMLARPFIRRSDPGTLLRKFLAGPPRLLASFARRLGQLHDEPRAVALVETLFSPHGPLGEPEALSGDLRRGFVKAAPAAPVVALTAIERSLNGPGRTALLGSSREGRRDFIQLLVLIAHDAALFGRAIDALIAFTLADADARSDLRARDHLLERFWPHLSFTLADQDLRLAALDRMLRDPDDRVRALGVEALDHMLDAGHFSSSLDLEFGARSLLTEWRPYNGEGFGVWFGAAYDRLTQVATSGKPEASRARDIVAEHIREQTDAGFGELAVDAVRAVRGSEYWERGWRAVNDALHFASRKPDAGDVELLQILERELRPKTRDDFFETFVLGEPWRHWHPSGRSNQPLRNVGRLAYAVGRSLAQQRCDPTPYLERAARAEGHNSVWQFTIGLSRHSSDRETLWKQAYDLFTKARPDERHPGLLGGILEGAKQVNRTWVDRKLDGIVSDPTLSDYLVVLHASVPLDAKAVQRFSRALSQGAIARERFALLMMGGVTKPIPGAVLADFLRQLFRFEDGILPALQILHMRLYGDRSDRLPVDPDLVKVSREFLADHRAYSDSIERQDHGLSEIAEVALQGHAGMETAREICTAMRESERRNRSSYREFSELCKLLMSSHSWVVLEEIVSQSTDEHLIGRFFGGFARNDEDLDSQTIGLDRKAIIDWVKEDPAERAVRIAYFIPYLNPATDTKMLQWSQIALDLINLAPEPESVLRTFEHRFFVGSGWGPYSLRFVRRRPLIEAMAGHEDSRIRAWARSARQRLEESIRHWDERDRNEDSRFE